MSFFISRRDRLADAIAWVKLLITPRSECRDELAGASLRSRLFCDVDLHRNDKLKVGALSVLATNHVLARAKTLELLVPLREDWEVPMFCCR